LFPFYFLPPRPLRALREISFYRFYQSRFHRNKFIASITQAIWLSVWQNEMGKLKVVALIFSDIGQEGEEYPSFFYL
ncbi:MAG TPA: hypothetical protein PLG43_11225, partial [Spirochaetia bacterium]|nr:hypothetical protein [Spirochaetia bacterium]